MTSRGKDEDRNFILSSFVELEEYFSSTVLLWQMKTSIPPLTPGNLLLAKYRLTQINDENLTKVFELIDSIIQKRKSAWNKKIKSELSMRLNQWQSIVDEIVDAGEVDHSYRYNVRVRVILELLQGDLPFDNEDMLDRLSILDHAIKSLIPPGDFIWEPDLASLFPADKFGYLHVRL